MSATGIDFTLSRLSADRYFVAPQTYEASMLLGPIRVWSVEDLALVLDAYAGHHELPDLSTLYLERREIARRETAALIERLTERGGRR
jgi:hypothetical protein